MEAEKSHSLPSISWRPRKSGGVILVWIWRPENQGVNGINPSPRTEQDWCPSSGGRQKQKGWIPPSHTLLFCSGPQETGWCPRTLRRVIYFTESTDLYSIQGRMMILGPQWKHLLSQVSGSDQILWKEKANRNVSQCNQILSFTKLFRGIQEMQRDIIF